jgi:hypothetical protein
LRTELLKLCHSPGIEVRHVLERARLYEAWVTDDDEKPVEQLLEETLILVGTPQGSA